MTSPGETKFKTKNTNSSAVNVPPDSFTYTWSNVNVIASPTMAPSEIIYNKIKQCFTKSKAPGPKQLLYNVNGMALQGELLAIMGSSGAGKTTLLNILAYQSPAGVEVAPNAERALNGHLVTAPELRAKCAYVQQDDLFIGTLSTGEHLLYHVGYSP